MEWCTAAPKPGDILRVKTAGIYHFGIYVSDDRIIQFGNTPSNIKMLVNSDIRVCASNMERFLCGGCFETAKLSSDELKTARRRDEIVSYAESRIGQGEYNIFSNNCEHFVYECVFGTKKTANMQVVKEMLKKFFVTDVYIAIIPDEIKYEKLYPESRNEMIERIRNESGKRQGYYAWKLLEYALKNSFDIDINDTDVHLNENGKWVCSECEFSISHCKSAVAAAVSIVPVGVDIEEFERERFKEGILRKIATDEEKEYDGDPALYTAKLWTSKESLFKQKDEKFFNPQKISASSRLVQAFMLEDEKSYIFSVASGLVSQRHIYLMKGGDLKRIEPKKL